ncbi:MAG: transporter substrate-binding domain-containing protein [Anaerolineae bacterium]|nr:transporter substrate-binding domain-containing protein [Anaerolineae bacterium]
MHRFLGLVALLVVFAGCADLAQLFPSAEEEGLPSAFVAPTPVPTYPPAMSTAVRILTRGEMVVGVRYDLEPFSYITTDSQLAGLEIDLARELARRWLGSGDAVRFVQVRSDTAANYIVEGTVDVVFAGLVHSQEDEGRVDFSPAYFSNGMALLTFPDTGISSLNDLNGRAVGVVNLTESQGALAAAAPVTPTYMTYGHTADAIEALRTRQIDVYADQRHRLERARRTVTGATIVGQWTSQPVAMIYRQDDPFFANLVRLTFEDMAADGTRDALYDRWLPGTSPPSISHLAGDAPIPSLDASPQQISDLSVISRIRDRGTVNVGYFQDRWPYSGDRADGVPTGFEIRLAERLAELWLGSSAAIAFVPVVDENDALARLERGEVDLLVGAWVQTRAGELRLDYSIPLLDDGVSLMSLASNPIEDLPQLSGQPVGVVAGSAGEAAVPAMSQGVGLSAIGYPSFTDALAALQSGEIVAILTERWPALDVHFRQTGFAFTDRRYTRRPVAYVMSQGDSDFRDLVNLSLMWLEAQGTYQELYSLWFDDPVPALDALPGRAGIPLAIHR